MKWHGNKSYLFKFFKGCLPLSSIFRYMVPMSAPHSPNKLGKTKTIIFPRTLSISWKNKVLTSHNCATHVHVYGERESESWGISNRIYHFWTHLDMVEGRFHQLTNNANSNLKHSQVASYPMWKSVMRAYTIWSIPNDSPRKSSPVTKRTPFCKPLFGYIPPATGRTLYSDPLIVISML